MFHKQQKMTVCKTEQHQTFTTSESTSMGGQIVVKKTVKTYTSNGNSSNGGTTVTTIHTTNEELTPEDFEKLALKHPALEANNSGVKITEVKTDQPEKSKGGLFSGLRKPGIFQKSKDKQVISGNACNAKKPDAKGSSSFARMSGSSITTGDFEADCLKKHNEYRAKHGVPPLQLSKELCCFAKEWADNIARSDQSMHRPNNKYGENIYMKWSSDPNHQITGNDPVDSWYSEIKDHVFGREPTSLKSGHFTQVIWKGSTELGVAQSRSKSGKIYVVANYNPAGNMIGDFASNVPPPNR